VEKVGEEDRRRSSTYGKRAERRRKRGQMVVDKPLINLRIMLS
jgi:hypothetical protein